MLSRYRSDIEGLRGIAVLLVLVFHFNLFDLGDAGFIGVDIFFVISGYLISAIIWKGLAEGTFSLKNFYVRRVRRLAPALIAVQMAVLLCAAIFLLPNEVHGLVRESLAAQAYVSNIYYWRTLNYFGVQANSAFMLHTWSLAVEEQFYFFYPIFLIVIHRLMPRYVVMVLCIAFAISFGLNIAFVYSKPEAVFYLLPTRAWEMIAGSIMAFTQPVFERSARARLVGAMTAAAVLIAALAIHRPGMAFPGFFALMPVASAALLLVAGSGGGNVVSTALSHPGVTFFGRISYPLYLVHWPINIFALTLLPDFSAPLRWGAFATSILLGLALTRFVERPIRQRTTFAADRQIIRAYVGGLLIMAIVAIVSVTSDGWRFRYGPQILQVADIADDKDVAAQGRDYRASAKIDGWLFPIGDRSKPERWIIYGDSHAAALTQSFASWLKNRSEAGVIAYHSNCMPLLNTGTETCRLFNRQIVEKARGRNVLLVSVWRQPLEVGFRGREGKVIEGPAAQQDASQAFAETVTALRAAGANVYVWEPLPTAQLSVPEATARSMLFGPYWPTDRTEAGFRAEMAWVADALRRAEVPASHRFDPAASLCPGGHCVFIRNGLPIYSDTNHPARHMSQWFAEEIGDKLNGPN